MEYERRTTLRRIEKLSMQAILTFAAMNLTIGCGKRQNGQKKESCWRGLSREEIARN